ncbi:hypothetical protein D3C77_800750 [compost metagenome]
MYAGHTGEQVSDAGGLQAVDVAAGEDGVGSAGGGARFDLAVGADQYFREFQGVIAVSGQQRNREAE